MTVENNAALEKMMRQAQERFDRTGKSLDALSAAVDSRAGGRTRAGLTGAIAGTLFWAAAYGLACYIVSGRIPVLLTAAAAAASVLLVVLMVADDVVQLRYYGMIFDVREKLLQLKTQLNLSRSALESNLRAFQSARTSGWELPLQAGPPVDAAAGQIDMQLSDIETLHTELLERAKNILYYLTCLVWTGAGSWAVYDAASPRLLSEGVPQGWIDGGMIILAVIATAASVLAAKAMWSQTRCAVNNLTLIAAAAGPAAFALVLAAVVAVVMIVLFIVQLVLAILGVVVVIAVLLGLASGG